MSIGIGLGAFMDGMQTGIAMRDKIDKGRLERKNRQQLEAINTDTKAAFDEKVAAGEQEPQDFEKFWKEYALPRRRMALIEQGDIDGAKALTEWGESDAALSGGKLFGSAMFKAQTGDYGGALQDAIKAGQVKGYIDHGYEFVSQDEIKGQDGKTVGYRLTLKGPDGKDIVQDVAAGDVPRVVATVFNPDAAWQSQVAARTDSKKREDEITDYERKKKIDRAYDKPTNATEPTERYRKAREDAAKNDLDWSSRTPEEQDTITRRALEDADRYAGKQAGTAGVTGITGDQPAAPAAAPKAGPKVIVDETTGQQVPLEATPLATPAPAQAPAARQGPRPYTGMGGRPLPLNWLKDVIGIGG